MDFVRVLYYKIMLFFGIADIYRNEQYMFKPDFFYNIEKLLITSNLNNLDRAKVNDNLCIVFLYICTYIYTSFSSLNNKQVTNASNKH